MATVNDITVSIIQDVMARMAAITNPPKPATPTNTLWLNGLIQAYDDNSIYDKLVGMVLPVAAIVYEGMVSHRDNTGRGEPKHSHEMGMAAAYSLSIIVVAQSDIITQTDFKTPAMNTLGIIRAAMRDTRAAPAQGGASHYWRFVSEQPAVIKKSVSVWVQRWSTPAILIGTPVPQP